MWVIDIRHRTCGKSSMGRESAGVPVIKIARLADLMIGVSALVLSVSPLLSVTLESL